MVSIAASSPAVSPSGPVQAGSRQPRFLQAGVFNDTNNALSFRDYLRLSDIKPVLVRSTMRGGKWIYRVLVGPFNDPGELTAMRRKLHADDTPTILVHE